MHRIISTIEAASRAGVAVAAVLVAAIFALMLAEIVARGAFSTSTLLSWEWSSYLMAAVMFLAAAGTARSGGHIRVGLPLSPVIARPLEAVWTIIAIAVCAFLTWTMADLAWQAVSRGIVAQSPQQTPLAWSHVPNLIGAALLTLQLVARLLRVLLGMPPELPEESAPESADR